MKGKRKSKNEWTSIENIKVYEGDVVNSIYEADLKKMDIETINNRLQEAVKSAEEKYWADERKITSAQTQRTLWRHEQS